MPTLTQWLLREKRMVAQARRAKRAVAPRRMRVVRGDTVQVRSGPDKGKEGVVTRVVRKTGRVVVQGVNFRKRVQHTPGKRSTVVRAESPIHVSSVALVDPADGKPCKVALRFLEDGSKVRVSKRSGAVVPKNMEVLLARDTRSVLNEAKDTPRAAAHKRTYFPPAGVAEIIAAARAGNLRM